MLVAKWSQPVTKGYTRAYWLGGYLMEFFFGQPKAYLFASSNLVDFSPRQG